MRKFQDLSCCLDAGLEPAFFFYRIFPVDWLLHSTLLSNLLKRKKDFCYITLLFLGRFAFRVMYQKSISKLREFLNFRCSFRWQILFCFKVRWDHDKRMAWRVPSRLSKRKVEARYFHSHVQRVFPRFIQRRWDLFKTCL